MPERRSSPRNAAKTNNKRKTRKVKEVESEDEDIAEEEEEEQDEEDEIEEEDLEEEEERVTKRVGKKVAKRLATPVKKTPAKRKAVEEVESKPQSKKGRRNPTTYHDDDDEELEKIQERFEDEQTNRFVSVFAHLLNDPTYADVVVRVKHDQHLENNRAKGKIYAHKMILSLHSKVLKAMIDSSKETLDGCTVIILDDDDMTFDVALALLEFVYKGSPKLSALDNTQNILTVEKAIEKYLEPQFLACFQSFMMSLDNIACYYESAEYHKERELSKKALKTIREYAPSISLRGISLATLKSFIEDDEFDIEEAPLFEKAVDWAHGIIEKERGKPIKPIIHAEDQDNYVDEEGEEEDNEIFTDENIIATRAKLLSPLTQLFRFGRIEAADFFTRVDKYQVLNDDDLLEIYPLVTKAYEPKPHDPRCKDRGEVSSSWLRSRYIKTIKSYLPNKKVQLQQIFHASNQGGLSSFWAHSRKSPLLAIFKTTTGHVFGFYTSHKWSTAGRNRRVVKSDMTLFMLGKGTRKEAKKLEATDKRTGIPFYDYQHGGNICLGDGHELNLQLYNGSATSRMHYCGQAAGQSLGGSYQFSVDDAICYTFKK